MLKAQLSSLEREMLSFSIESSCLNLSLSADLNFPNETFWRIVRGLLSYNVANTVEWSAIVSPDVFSYNVDNTMQWSTIVSPDALSYNMANTVEWSAIVSPDVLEL